MAAKRGAVDENGGGFWARFAVLTVVVLWVSLIGGNWLGNYLMKTNPKFANSLEEDYRTVPDQRSRLHGRPPVQVTKPTPATSDEQGEPAVEGSSPEAGVGAPVAAPSSSLENGSHARGQIASPVHPAASTAPTRRHENATKPTPRVTIARPTPAAKPKKTEDAQPTPIDVPPQSAPASEDTQPAPATPERTDGPEPTPEHVTKPAAPHAPAPTPDGTDTDN